MARFEANGLESLCMDFNEIANTTDDVIQDMLKAEGNIIGPAQKNEAQKMGVYDTGAMIRSLTVKAPKKYKDGWRVYITFKGSRTRGKTKTTNAEIAFINEFGKTGQRARPFISSANEGNIDKAVSAAEDVYDKFLRKNNL